MAGMLLVKSRQWHAAAAPAPGRGANRASGLAGPVLLPATSVRSCTSSTSTRKAHPSTPHPPQWHHHTPLLTLQRALVHLVHKHVRHGQERGVSRQAAQQDAGGAEEQARVAAGGGVQPHVVAHLAGGGG